MRQLRKDLQDLVWALNELRRDVKSDRLESIIAIIDKIVLDDMNSERKDD